MLCNRRLRQTDLRNNACTEYLAEAFALKSTFNS
jgi:hypothetical protein